MKRFMKTVVSAFMVLAVILLVPMASVSVKACVSKCGSASFISRCDGIWYWPTTVYKVSDWSGCNGGPSGANICQFCANQHPVTCQAEHNAGHPKGHIGIDIPVQYQRVYAAASGTLYCTENNWASRGIVAVVEHPIGNTGWSYYSVYEHLHSVESSKNGQSVAAGEEIGISGNTGTKDLHLHFEILMYPSNHGAMLAADPNTHITYIEHYGYWLTASGFDMGMIVVNPALNSPAGTDYTTVDCPTNTRLHAGSVMYTRNASEVSIGENRACEHNYSSVEIPASCIENGVINYTCSSCGDTYSEPVEKLGHNYVDVWTPPTCNSLGYTTYTCSRCGDNYIEESDGWSEWSTEYPSGVAEELIETKMQYSTLEKEYTTSDSDTLEGWTYMGTTESDWSVDQTTTTKPMECETLRITNTTQTGWGYQHYCNNYGNGNGFKYIDSIPYGVQSMWHGYISGIQLPAFAMSDKGGQQPYGGSGSGALPCAYNFYVWFRDPNRDVYTYTYQTKTIVNQFFKWADEWSEWSDEEIEESEDCQVKTQKVYRYMVFCPELTPGPTAEPTSTPASTPIPDITAELKINNTTSPEISPATITAPSGGWVEGDNIFIVACEKPCFVAISYDGGQSYQRLVASLDADGYSFIATDMTANTILAVGYVGDVNGDGSVSNSDATRLAAIYASKTSATDELMSLLCDVNNDSEITNSDITALRAAYAGKRQLSW